MSEGNWEKGYNTLHFLKMNIFSPQTIPLSKGKIIPFIQEG